MASNYKLKADFLALFLHIKTADNHVMLIMYTLLQRKTLFNFILQDFSRKQIDFNIYLFKCGFYEETFTCIKCLLTI